MTALLFASCELLADDGRDFLHLASCLASQPIPLNLVRGVFKHLGRTEENGELGLDQTEKMNLSRQTGKDAWSVHALVSRAMQLRGDKGRIEAIRDACLEHLTETLPVVADIREHDALRLEVVHARHLASAAMTAAEATLLNLVAYYDDVRGLYTSARKLHEQALSVRRRLLGVEHPDTLTSMYDLAANLYKQGDRPRARKLLIDALECAQRTLEETNPIRIALEAAVRAIGS